LRSCIIRSLKCRFAEAFISSSACRVCSPIF
jgi:hypothetical protein